MTTREEHRRLVARNDFQVPTLESFTTREREMLRRFGSWMEALVKCEIPATSEQQCRLVMVDRGELAAKSEYEVAWVKYKEVVQEGARAREELRELEEKLADDRAETQRFLRNLGIPDWDFS